MAVQKKIIESVLPESQRVNGVQVIARAAQILRTLAHNTQGLSLGEIAKMVELPRSTVQRIVDALEDEQLVLASSATMGVRLGPGILALASATVFEIAEMARGTLERLSKETGETVDLSIIDQDKAVFVDQIQGQHRLVAMSAVGEAFPLHCSANGKAALALMAESELQRTKRRMKLVEWTPNTITTWEKLDQEISTIRKTGLAYDREEHSLDICAVAAALRSPSGEIAAISIPAPTRRFEGHEGALGEALQRHCAALRRKLDRS